MLESSIRQLDEDEICALLARAVADLVEPLPLSVALREDGGAPPGELVVDPVALAAVAETLPPGVSRTEGAHALACKGRRKHLEVHKS